MIIEKYQLIKRQILIGFGEHKIFTRKVNILDEIFLIMTWIELMTIWGFSWLWIVLKTCRNFLIELKIEKKDYHINLTWRPRNLYAERRNSGGEFCRLGRGRAATNCDLTEGKSWKILSKKILSRKILSGKSRKILPEKSCPRKSCQENPGKSCPGKSCQEIPGKSWQENPVQENTVQENGVHAGKVGIIACRVGKIEGSEQ